MGKMGAAVLGCAEAADAAAGRNVNRGSADAAGDGVVEAMRG